MRKGECSVPLCSFNFLSKLTQAANCVRFCLNPFCCEVHEVRKRAKIRNRYNQILHLTKDTLRESDKNTRKHHIQESQEVSSFPAGDHKDAYIMSTIPMVSSIY